MAKRAARVQFVARADDLGSSQSANTAIDAVTRAGFIKNVSIMAPGPFVEQAATLFAGRRDICFGMHTTLNAEWDRVKWRPVLPLGAKSGLVDENGWFLNDPKLLAATKPDLDTILREMDAQLERLHKLGFDIRYVDTHMFPELYIPGLDGRIQEFAQKKGLMDHMHYYALPPGYKELAQHPKNMLNHFKNLPTGQYFFVTHPAVYSGEMLQTGNAAFSGEQVAAGRAAEAKLFSRKALCRELHLVGCEGVRYDEAAPLPRLCPSDVAKMLA